MTQVDQGWGAGPTARYEQLAARFRPIFDRIGENAVSRDAGRKLPYEEIDWLKDAGFSALRVPAEDGGLGVTLPEFFNLLIELSQADSNVTNAMRSHFGFTEDILNSGFPDHRRRWLDRIAGRELIGSGFSEVGEANVGVNSTRLVSRGDHWLLNGEKYYTSGSLFADWINLGAADEDNNPVGGLIPTRAPGVEILDDWDGFGQALTSSGTAIFTDVVVANELINPGKGRCRYVGSFFQLVHLATLAGIGRAAANDLARLVSARKRVYSHGNADTSGKDPQILQVVGRVRGAAYSAGAIVLKTAEALERVYDRHLAGDTEAENAAGAIAELEVCQAVTVVTSLILEATTVLFDALGASGVKRTNGLDRHWRNARTISSHNPRIYRDRTVGDFAVNGTLPPLRGGPIKA
jgi:alkylation response protein AidB-like acyl-CoA dehydrogenase